MSQRLLYKSLGIRMGFKHWPKFRGGAVTLFAHKFSRSGHVWRFKKCKRPEETVCLSLYCKVTWMSTERRTSFLNLLWFIRVILEANPAKTINSPACSRASWHQSVRSRTHPPSEVVEHLPRCENDRDSLGAPENGGILQENPEICPLKENVSCKCSFKVYINRNSNRL